MKHTLSRRRLLASMSAASMTPVLSLSGCANPADIADLILINGEVHTVDDNDHRAEAIAIKANRIIAVGQTKEIKAFKGPNSRQIDLQGRTVLPGINDSHLHLLGAGVHPLFSLDLSFPNVKSIADCVVQVAAAVKEAPQGEWIQGRGWDQPYFTEGRAPTAADLDAVSPDHPVALTEFSGHALWVNSKAMTVAGITADTVPPPGGVIVKNEKGQPTGLLFEAAAWMVRDHIPAPTSEQNKAALRATMQQLIERGITSCTVPGQSPEILQQMNELASETFDARIRITGLVRAPDSLLGLQETLSAWSKLEAKDPLWFQLPGVKIFGDGIPTGNKTAWLHEPYEGGGNGSLIVKGETDDERVAEITAMIELIHRHDLQIGTHVTGDKSIDTVVEAYVRAQQAGARPSPRHYIIHGDLVSPQTLQTMSTHGIGANFNPEIKYLIADSQIAAIGAARAAYEWPYRSAFDAGVVVASSSDGPVTEGNWLQGIATCLERKGKQTGNVSGPEQRISLDEAIRSYTWAGAWQDHAESYKGSLQTGYSADICIMDERISTAAPQTYAKSKVAMTIIDGRVAHDTLGAD